MSKKNINLSNKQKVLSAGIAFCVLATGLFCFLFYDDIMEKRNTVTAESLGWSDEELGDIIITEEEIVEEEEAEVIVDSIGVEYKTYQIKSRNMEVLLPSDWGITTDGNMIHSMSTSFVDDTSHIQITITPTGQYNNKETSLLAVRNNSYSAVSSLYRYNGYSDNYTFSQYTFVESSEQSDDLKLYQKTTGRLKSNTLASDYLNPYISCYYFYIDNHSYALYVVGPSNKEVEIEEIAKTVIASVKPVEYEITHEAPLDTSINMSKGDVSITIPISTTWVSENIRLDTAIDNYEFTATDNIESPLFGTKITYQLLTLPKEDMSIGNRLSFANIFASHVLSTNDTQAFAYLSSGSVKNTIQVYTKTNGVLMNRSSLKEDYTVFYDARDSSNKMTDYLQLLHGGEVTAFTYTIQVSEDICLSIHVNYNEYNEDVISSYIDDIASRITEK